MTDVNEVPELTGTPETEITLGEHDANETYTTPTVADYDASDEEGGVTWTLTGARTAATLPSAQQRRRHVRQAAPNYEKPEDSGGNNV